MTFFRKKSGPIRKCNLAFGAIVLLGGVPQIANAQAGPCASLGSLRSLSTTADGSQSLWLSRTTGGAVFALDATVSSSRVDTWIGQGVHISASPVVAVGPAGAHTLSEISGDSKGCDIETTNQLARPSQVLPPVPGGGGGSGGGSGSGSQLSESAIIGFSPILLGRVSITERLKRRSLGPWGIKGPRPQTEDGDDLAWFDATARFADNNQAGRNGDDSSAQLILGMDVWRNDTVQIGLAGGFETARADSFNSTVSADVDSIFIGPYLGWTPDDYTLVDVWLGYANRDFSNNIGAFGSSFDADRFFVDANITRRIPSGNFSIFPKLGVFYANDDLPSHQYSNGVSAVDVDAHSADTVIARLAVDIWNTPISGSNGLQWLPFVSAGVDWYAKRPGEGLVLDNGLQIESVGDVMGSVEVGTDILTQGGGRWTTRLRYDGLGQNDYYEVAAEVAFNFRF